MKINEVLSRRSEQIYGPFDQVYINIQRDCSKALTAFNNGRAIFKGLLGVTVPIMETDPTKVERKSANTYNHYTLLLDNLPSWRWYPKRSRSLICSTSQSRATKYGTVYLVLPFNEAKIGVCSKDDIWRGFNLDTNLGVFVEDLKEVEISDDSYQQLLSSTLRIKYDVIDKFRDDLSMYHFCNNLKKSETIEDVEKAYDMLLNPNLNEFELTNVRDIPKWGSNREVWTDSKSYLIKVKSEFYEKYLDN